MSRSVDRANILPTSRALAVLVVVSSLTACDVPNYEGPALQEPPQGFLLQADARGGTMFENLAALHSDTWVQSLPPYSTIYINGFAGTLTLTDVMAAQDSGRVRAEDPDITFGAIEPLTIDGHDALAWEERIDTPTRGIPWVAYRVMVPYDTISYTIEFSTEDPLFKAGAPASMRDVAAVFAVGETVYNWPLIAIGIGLLLLAGYMMRQRSDAKARQLQSIRLVKIEKPEEEQSELELEAAASAPHTESAATRPAPPPPSPPTGGGSTQ